MVEFVAPQVELGDACVHLHAKIHVQQRWRELVVMERERERERGRELLTLKVKTTSRLLARALLLFGPR